MLEKLKALCLSKQTILTTFITLLFNLSDLKGFIADFSANLIIFIPCLIALIIAFLYHFVAVNKKEYRARETATEENMANEKFSSPGKEKKSSVSLLSKLIFAVIFPLVILTVGSLYYLKNADIYFVVLEKNLSYKQAENLKNKTNNDSRFKDQKLAVRFIDQPRSIAKYELILKQGFLNKEKANENLMRVNELQTQFKPYVVGPQKHIGYLRKIIYLQNHIIN